MSNDSSKPLLDAAYPVALFPVRLETRYVLGDATTGAGTLLQVRVYPDGALLADTHDPALSGTEQLAAAQYASSIAASPGDAAHLFGSLCDRFGEPRAAYIASQATTATAPTNPPDPSGRSVPTALLLPDRWYAVAYRAGQRVAEGWSNPIQGPVQLGPSFAGDTPPTIGDGQAQPALEESLKWLYDFSAAQSIGMALTLTLDNATPLDRLVVVGLREANDPAAAASAVNDWVTKQRYSHGFALVPQGTPTRNANGVASGYTTKPSSHDEAYAALNGGLFNAGDGSDGDVFSSALGLPALLSNVAGAGGRDQKDSGDMVTALWPVTWGYFLETMMAPYPVSPPAAQPSPMFSTDQIAWARRHAIDRLRPRGPLPAFRVGELVYGVLPVTTVESYSTSNANEKAVVGFLNKARPLWEQAQSSAVRLGMSADPESDLLAVLRQTPSSSFFAVEPIRGADFFDRLQSFLSVNFFLPNWRDLRGGLSDALFGRVGLSGRPRLAYATMEASSGQGFVPLNVPMVAPVLSEASWTNDPDNFVQWMQSKATYTDLRDDVNFSGNKAVLLYKILRHSVLLAYGAAARFGYFPLLGWFERELVNLASIATQNPPTIWNILDRIPAAETTAAGSLLTTLMQGTATVGASDARQPFVELRDSLCNLAMLSTAALDRAVTETLDTASFRLDAWITSFATLRLSELRAATPANVWVGAYGWIDGLGPAGPATPATPPAGYLGGALTSDPENGGFIVAPSLRHAKTAAVLRSGQLAHDAALGVGTMAFDVSSARVRAAQHLIEGIQSGQPLGALLGYQLERALHESALDQYIAPLRSLYPLIVGKRPDTVSTLPAESLGPSNVVDGVLLHKSFVSGDCPFGQNGLPAPDASDFQGLCLALEGLDEAYAAVSDVLIAEGVHQLVNGSPARANAALAAISAGDSVSTDLEVLTTPRSGLSITHRLGILLDASTSTSDWPTGSADRHLRALAEPRLDSWLGRWLGDPHAVRCAAQAVDPANGNAPVGTPLDVSLDKLDLSPLDVMALASQSDTTELSARIVSYAASIDATHPYEVVFGAASSWSPTDVDFPTFFASARRLKALVTLGRPMDARDLALTSDGSSTTGIDVTELGARITAAIKGLGDAITALSTSTSMPQYRTALWRASYFGVSGAVPSANDADIPVQVKAASATLTARQKVADQLSAALAAPGAPSDPTGTSADPGLTALTNATAMVRAIFGSDFVIVPQFLAASPTAVQAAFATDLSNPSGDPLPVVTWLQQVARIRRPADILNAAVSSSEALTGGSFLSFSVCQLSPRQTDPKAWVGFAPPVGPGIVSTALVAVGTPTAAAPLAGLLLDQWTETTPNANEMAGVTFNYDTPTNRSPHAVLLAVPAAKPAPLWSYDSIEAVVSEALALAKLRAVDSTALFSAKPSPTQPNLNQYLPATYLAANTSNETISTRFDDIVPTSE